MMLLISYWILISNPPKLWHSIFSDKCQKNCCTKSENKVFVFSMSLLGNGLNIWMGSISRDKLSISKTDIAQYSPYKSGFQERAESTKSIFIWIDSRYAASRIPSKLAPQSTSDIWMYNFIGFLCFEILFEYISISSLLWFH